MPGDLEDSKKNDFIPPEEGLDSQLANGAVFVQITPRLALCKAELGTFILTELGGKKGVIVGLSYSDLKNIQDFFKK